MAALTADRARSIKGTPIGFVRGVKDAETIYSGAIVLAAADGYAAAATDAAGLALLGIAAESADNSAGADGDLEGP